MLHGYACRMFFVFYCCGFVIVLLVPGHVIAVTVSLFSTKLTIKMVFNFQEDIDQAPEETRSEYDP